MASMATGENVEQLVVSPYEIAEVTNILNGLMICMDDGKSMEFSNFFLDSPDSSLKIVLANKNAYGREEIAKVCAFLHHKFCSGNAPCKHWEGNIYIKKIRMQDVNEAVLVNKSYWKSIKGGEVQSTGVHNDVFKKDKLDGRWYLFHRIIQHTWTKAGGFIK